MITSALTIASSEKGFPVTVPNFSLYTAPRADRKHVEYLPEKKGDDQSIFPTILQRI